MHLKFLLSAAIVLCLGGGAAAETLPLPQVDYEMTAKIAGGGTMSSRHSGGKIRTEIRVPGMPGPMVGYIDLKARKMVSLMSLPGQPPMAMEGDIGDDPSMGFAVGNGVRTGTGKAAGESCDLWKIDAPDPEDKEFDGTLCITKDGITVSFEGTMEKKREKIFEATSVKRGAQDPKLFEVPANVQRVKPEELLKGPR